MFNIIKTLDRLLGRLEYGLLVLLTAALTLILSAQVILRYFFSSPLFWAEEVAVQILISASFIGVSYLLFSNKLVRVDFILENLGKPWGNWLHKGLQLLSLLVLLVLCYFATDWILRPEIKADVSPTTQLPRWYNYAVLVVSFYCMAWHQLINLITPNGQVHSETAL
ncbi:putative TRAP-type C4-dicarboxylate transport system small permease [Oceanimonas sp. GK1]|uniref:TRAP transporter small permease n=1 Tax=Oceanimonas sp. (strain GK1 / IBRC-M 10197) TaxID=511062 RepID=UPI0002494C12|nr:TRAP transporter small permease [Oceanimonas sp. GK1]AEY00362.1 putative TRAP-type C4-dicarboxylate transport system small permease [Oceanimonas sp. GK1]